MVSNPLRHNSHLSPQRSGPYDWSPEAERLVRQKQRIHPSNLVEQLQAMTGYPLDACWRFAYKFGVKRPTRYHRWTRAEREKVLEMSEGRPVGEIARHFGVSAKAIYHVIARSERRVSRRSEWFGLHAVARYLTVKPARVRSWIASEKLRGAIETHGQLTYTMISGAELAKFCKSYKSELLRQRIPEKRIQFLVDYVIAAEMPDDYTARSSKLERRAYERGEFLKPESAT
jgi:hypothetical protein